MMSASKTSIHLCLLLAAIFVCLPVAQAAPSDVPRTAAMPVADECCRRAQTSRFDGSTKTWKTVAVASCIDTKPDAKPRKLKGWAGPRQNVPVYEKPATRDPRKVC